MDPYYKCVSIKFHFPYYHNKHYVIYNQTSQTPITNYLKAFSSGKIYLQIVIPKMGNIYQRHVNIVGRICQHMNSKQM